VAVALWLPLISTSGGNGSGTAAAAAATRRQANSSSWQFAASGAAVTNPMRGFRHQIDGFCGDPHHSGDPGGEKAVAAGLKVCEQLNMTVSLSYCYLSPWWNISLPSAMLTNLDARLGDMRRAGVSALLNFGYEDGKTNFHDDVEPYGFPQIYAHVDQLTPVLLRNADVIYGLQAGFIGNAGEWAHDIRGLLTNVSGLATLVSKLLYQAVPDRQVLVRKGEEKLHMLQGTAFAHCAGQPPVCSGAAAAAQQQAGLGSDEAAVTALAQQHWAYGVVDGATAHTQASFARLGHYNAAFMSTTGDAGVFKPAADMRSPWFAYFSREAPYVAVDGEMYYGTPWPAKQRLLVEGHEAAVRMMQHSYRTFSHHNSYWPIDTEATPHPENKSLNTWIHTPLDVHFIREEQLPITDAYANESANRNGTIYEYIRDHLGFRLELQSATAAVERNGSRAVIRLDLVMQNHGMGAPVNARDWTIALLSSGVTTNQSRVVWQSEPSAMVSAGTDWRLLYPHVPGDPLRAPVSHRIALAARLPASHVPPGSSLEVGVSLLDPLAITGPGGADAAMAMAVRFTNPRRWVRGVNVLGSL
jgi:hypothetical protein